MKTLFSNPVVVAHPKTKQVITLFSKMDKEGIERNYGRVRIDSVTPSIVDGFVSAKKRTAFVTLDEDALILLEGHIKDNRPYPIEGKIVVKETLEPQFTGHTPKINPSTGETIEVNGYQVYRTTEFTSDMDAQDVRINSNSVEEHELKLNAKSQLIESDEVI